MTEPADETTARGDRLEQLAAELDARGYHCQTGVLLAPPLLWVLHPTKPWIGRTVTVTPGPDTGTPTWWFRFPGGAFICECDQLHQAADLIATALDMTPTGPPHTATSPPEDEGRGSVDKS